MNPVLKRTLAGLAVGAGVVGLFLYMPLTLFFPLLLVLTMLVQLEFYQMAKAYEPVTVFGLLMGATWISWTAATPAGHPLVGFLVPGAVFGFLLAFFALCVLVLFRARHKNPVGTIASTLFGFFYVPFLTSFFLRFAQLQASAPFGMPASRVGFYTLFALIAVCKFSDTGGFAFGLSFGKHKMCPSISPKKSWEGLLGSCVFSAVAAAVFLAVARACGWGAACPLWGKLTYPAVLAGGAFLALVATVGDLIESRIKRECGVKDSSTFLPAGMGGFLDVFDSILFIPAIAYPAFLWGSFAA